MCAYYVCATIKYITTKQCVLFFRLGESVDDLVYEGGNGGGEGTGSSMRMRSDVVALPGSDSRPSASIGPTAVCADATGAASEKARQIDRPHIVGGSSRPIEVEGESPSSSGLRSASHVPTQVVSRSPICVGSRRPLPSSAASDAAAQFMVADKRAKLVRPMPLVKEEPKTRTPPPTPSSSTDSGVMMGETPPPPPPTQTYSQNTKHPRQFEYSPTMFRAQPFNQSHKEVYLPYCISVEL